VVWPSLEKPNEEKKEPTSQYRPPDAQTYYERLDKSSVISCAILIPISPKQSVEADKE
jgi:hypothetical protein